MVATLFEWFYGKSPSDKIFIFGKWAQNGRALGCLWVGQDVSPIASPLHSVQCHKTMMCVSSPSPLCCCHLQQVHWGETHVRDGTLLEFPVKWCVYICIISELTPFSAPRPPNLHDLLPRTRVSWPETESGKRWCWIVGTCDLHLVPWEVTTLRNVVGAGAEKIVWVRQLFGGILLPYIMHTYAVLCTLLRLDLNAERPPAHLNSSLRSICLLAFMFFCVFDVVYECPYFSDPCMSWFFICYFFAFFAI